MSLSDRNAVIAYVLAVFFPNLILIAQAYYSIRKLEKRVEEMERRTKCKE
jgi:hypothetical protein